MTENLNTSEEDGQEKVKKISKKYCIVPYCNNSSVKCRDKIFFCVPRAKDIRDAWREAMDGFKREPGDKTAHCCQDHFNLDTDVLNPGKNKSISGVIKLKPQVVPHRFECQDRDDGSSEITITIPPDIATSIEEQIRIAKDHKTIQCLKAVLAYTNKIKVDTGNDLYSFVSVSSHLFRLLDKVVYEWFQRTDGIVTNEMLIEKARNLKKMFCIESFNPDQEWVKQFKMYYNISHMGKEILQIENNTSSLSNVDINEIVLDVLKKSLPAANSNLSNSKGNSKNISKRKRSEIIYDAANNNLSTKDILNGSTSDSDIEESGIIPNTESNLETSMDIVDGTSPDSDIEENERISKTANNFVTTMDISDGRDTDCDTEEKETNMDTSDGKSPDSDTEEKAILFNIDNIKETSIDIADDKSKIEVTEDIKSHGLTIISNDEQAKTYLKPLLEYVLLKDNFGALAHISHLMDMFSGEKKTK